MTLVPQIDSFFGEYHGVICKIHLGRMEIMIEDFGLREASSQELLSVDFLA